VDDVLVGLGVACGVVDVPAQGHEQRIEEFVAELGFVVGRSAVGVAVAVEGIEEIGDDGWCGHKENPFVLKTTKTGLIIVDTACPRKRGHGTRRERVGSRFKVSQQRAAGAHFS